MLLPKNAFINLNAYIIYVSQKYFLFLAFIGRTNDRKPNSKTFLRYKKNITSSKKYELDCKTFQSIYVYTIGMLLL